MKNNRVFFFHKYSSDKLSTEGKSFENKTAEKAVPDII